MNNNYEPNFQMLDSDSESNNQSDSQESEAMDKQAEIQNRKMPYLEEDIREIVRDEISQSKAKFSWLRVIAFILVGAILGTGGTFALFKMGALENLNHEEKSQFTETVQPEDKNYSIDISLNEDSTIENAVANKAIPTIVGITAFVKGQLNPFNFYNEIPEYAEAVGSGVIVDPNGYILTNSHVINNGNAEKLTVSYSNDESAEAEIVWFDQTLDLAVIKTGQTALPAADLGNSDDVQVGDKAIAVGNPLGLDLQSTLTSGYISGLDRTINIQGGNIMDGLIQTDAAINSGNSGGPLLNAKGEVIGINTARPQTADGIGFAIPINSAKPIIEKIIEIGSFKPLYIGISGQNAQMVSKISGEDLPAETGVVIYEVFKNSPAAQAKLKVGDIITSIDDMPVDSMNSLKTYLLQYEVGDSAEITLYRGQEKMIIELVFSEFNMESIEG